LRWVRGILNFLYDALAGDFHGTAWDPQRGIAATKSFLSHGWNTDETLMGKAQTIQREGF
jgi:hypothetical protein